MNWNVLEPSAHCGVSASPPFDAAAALWSVRRLLWSVVSSRSPVAEGHRSRSKGHAGSGLFVAGLTNRYDANSSSNAFASFRSRVSKPSVNQPQGALWPRCLIATMAITNGCQRWRRAAQVVHSHDTGFVGKVEHWGQNQCAQEQPQGSLQTFPLKN